MLFANSVSLLLGPLSIQLGSVYVCVYVYLFLCLPGLGRGGAVVWPGDVVVTGDINHVCVFPGTGVGYQRGDQAFAT